MYNPKSHRMIHAAVLTMALTGLAATPLAFAANGNGSAGSSAQQSQTMKQFQQARRHLQQVRGKLGTIQKAALKKHPELKAQESHLRDLVIQTMKANGHDPKTAVKQMKALQAKLSDKNLAKDKRHQAIQELQKRRRDLRKAQLQALHDKKVQAAQEKFRKGLLAAMRDQNSNTDKLITDLQNTEAKMRKIVMRARQAGGSPKS